MTNYLLPVALIVLLAVAFAVTMLWSRSRALALALGVGVPLALVGFFAWHGLPVAPAPAPEAAVATDEVADAPTAPPADLAPEDVDKLVETAMADVDARIAADPNAFDACAMKGNIHMQLQQFAQARDAFKRAHEILPEDDVVAVAYAESMVRTNPELGIGPEALALFERAANATPPDERAIYFLGMHRMQVGKPDAAADLWESLLPRLPEEGARHLRPQIEAARAAAARMAGASPTGPGVDVTIDVAPELAARAPKGSVLYVFARRAGAGGAPIAVERVIVAGWPVRLTLDDADSAMATQKLSSVPKVEVTARLALTGAAQASPGDLESPAVAVATADRAAVTLWLAQVRQ
jgi:cytochrome c-type biogenesis protein CcmH